MKTTKIISFIIVFMISLATFCSLNQRMYVYESEFDNEIHAYGWPYSYLTSCQCKKCHYLFNSEFKWHKGAIYRNVAVATLVSLVISLVISIDARPLRYRMLE